MALLYGDKTPEELYQMSTDFGDMEYEAAVAGNAGPLTEPYINADAQNTILYKDPNKRTTLLGTAITPSIQDDYKSYDEDKKRRFIEDQQVRKGIAYSDAINPRTGEDTNITNTLKAGSDKEEPSIFTYGAEATRPDVQTHEFRHIAMDMIRRMEEEGLDDKQVKALQYLKRVLPEGIGEEGWNRAFDAYRSSEPSTVVFDIFQKWAVNGSGDFDDLKNWEQMKEKYLHNLKNYADTFAKVEAASRELEGHTPPKKKSWKEYYMSQFDKRLNKIVAGLDDEYVRFVNKAAGD